VIGEQYWDQLSTWQREGNSGRTTALHIWT